MINRVRRLFSRPAEELPELPEITLRPIGVVRNSVKEPMPSGWERVRSRIVLRPELEEALLGLNEYSHVFVLFWPHRIPAEVLGSKPRLYPMDNPEYPLQGVLATRAQIRFNPILVSAVRLLAVKGSVLTVEGLDAIDGTPVLDIKPYFPDHDAVPDAVVARWARERLSRDAEGRAG